MVVLLRSIVILVVIIVGIASVPVSNFTTLFASFLVLLVEPV
jgi:hypothetical protein